MRQSFLVRAGALVLSGTMAACGSRVAVDTSKDDSATTMASGSSSGGGGAGGIGPNGAEGGGGNSTTTTIYDLPPAQDEGMAIVQKLCPTIAAEKHLCVGLRPGTAWHTVALSPDTGAVCVMGEIETPLYGTNQTIAVVGEYLYGCDWNVWRVALTGGPQEPLDIPRWCDQIVADGDHFLVSPKLSSATLYHYASFDDLAADTPLETLTLDAAGSAFAIQEVSPSTSPNALCLVRPGAQRTPTTEPMRTSHDAPGSAPAPRCDHRRAHEAQARPRDLHAAHWTMQIKSGSGMRPLNSYRPLSAIRWPESAP